MTTDDAARTIRVGHSPDSDDAFMFYALTHDKLDTGGLRFVHQLEDIETLNRRALNGELEVSAVSLHAYAHMAERYALLASGCSMGDRYGPKLVARRPMTLDEVRGATIAIPGTLTTAYLALQLCLGKELAVQVTAVRPDHPRRAGGPVRGRPDHPRGAALLSREGPAPGPRPRPMVVRADGLAPAARRQRRPPRPRRRRRSSRSPSCSSRASSTPWTTARRPSTTPWRTPEASTRPWPTASSACTSTSGRSTMASAAARPSGP